MVKNKHYNINLQKDFNYYGIENFEFSIIAELEQPKHIEFEDNFLQKSDFKELYNISKNAKFGDVITNHPNRKEIIEKTTKNYIYLEEYNKTNDNSGNNNPNWKGGISFKIFKCKTCGCEIYKNKLGYCKEHTPKEGKYNSFYNKRHSEETKKLLSEQRKGKFYGNNEKSLSIDGKIYKSYAQASRELKIPLVTIRFRCLSKNNKFVNYILLD